VRSYYATITLENGKPTQLRNGGTSAGAPLLAGLLATITSGLKKTFGKNTFTGFINPYLYEQYNSRQRKELFIDVPAGSNNASTYDVAESPDDWDGKFVAVIQGRVKHYLLPLNGTGVNGTLDANLSGTGKGFDAASGLGSINGQTLFDGLSQIWSTL
jgi:subtilase family serine protease